MIKKVYLIFLLLVLNVYCFSKESLFFIKNGSKIFDFEQNKYKLSQNNKEVSISNFDYSFYNYNEFYQSYFIEISSTDDYICVSSFDLIPKDTDELIQEEYITKVKDGYHLIILK